MKVSEFMKPVQILPPDAPVQEAAAVIKETGVNLVAVGSEDQLRGVVTPRDITVSAVADPCKVEVMPLEEIATPVMAFCNENQELEQVLVAMRTHQQTRLLVQNGEGRVVGAITLEDILQACPLSESVVN